MRGSSRARSREWERRGVQRADCGARAGGGRRSLKSSGIRTNERRERPDEPDAPRFLFAGCGAPMCYLTYFIFIPGRNRTSTHQQPTTRPTFRRWTPNRAAARGAGRSASRASVSRLGGTIRCRVYPRPSIPDTAPSARRPTSKTATKGARDPTATQKHLGTLDPVPRLK